MPDETVGGPLGRWHDADLAGTAQSAAGLGADADFPRATRFIGRVAKLLVRRRAIDTQQADTQKIAVFLLHPVPRELTVGEPPKRVPWLDNGLTPLAGRIWFVSETVTRGNYVEFGDRDDDDVVRVITDVLQVGNVPAVVYDPRLPTPEARYFPSGVESEEYELLNLGSTPVSEELLAQAVDRVYVTQLATPDVQPKGVKLWKDEQQGWPVSDAEARIHAQVMAGLAGGFPTCTIRHEQTSVAGRLDILVEESHPTNVGSVTHHAVIELKVLRTFRSTGTIVSDSETRDWVEEGVEQASSYRNNRSAKIAGLYCFDMRRVQSGETCFDHVRGTAGNLKVHLRVWFIFSASKDFRGAEAAGTV